MKTIKYAVAAIALSTLSFGAFAAEPVSASQTQNLHKIGVVSADGATTLDGWKLNWLKKPPLLAQALITSPPPWVMTK